MLAAFTTLDHLSISARMKAAKSPGLPGAGSAPWPESFSETSGERNARNASALSRASTSFGVAAGAGEDDGAHVVVGVECGAVVGDTEVHLLGKRVQLVRSVEEQGGDAVAFDYLDAHGVTGP